MLDSKVSTWHNVIKLQSYKVTFVLQARNDVKTIMVKMMNGIRQAIRCPESRWLVRTGAGILAKLTREFCC